MSQKPNGHKNLKVTRTELKCQKLVRPKNWNITQIEVYKKTKTAQNLNVTKIKCLPKTEISQNLSCYKNKMSQNWNVPKLTDQKKKI